MTPEQREAVYAAALAGIPAFVPLTTEGFRAAIDAALEVAGPFIAAEALRAAAIDREGLWGVQSWLRERADAIERGGAHTPVVCTCRLLTCMFCEGGLFGCSVCGSLESATTTHCPGGRMAAEASDAVYAGTLDFRDGAWREGECSRSSPRWFGTPDGQAELEAYAKDKARKVGQ